MQCYIIKIIKKSGKELYFYKPNIRYNEGEINNDSYKLMSLGSIYFIATNFLFEKIK